MQKLKPKTKKGRIESNNTVISTFINIQIFSLISYLIVFLIFSFAALMADLPQKYDFYFSLIIFLICSFVTGFYAGIKIRQNGLLVGVIYSLPMNALVLIISLIFADFKVDFTLFITAAVLLLSSAAGGIVAVNKRHRR